MRKKIGSLLTAAALLAGAIIMAVPTASAAESPVLYHCKCGNKYSTALEGGVESWKSGKTKCFAACDGVILEWTALDPTKSNIQPGNYYLVDNSTQDNATNRSQRLDIGTASVSGGTFNIDMNGLDYRTINTKDGKDNFFTAILVGYNSTLNLCNTKSTGGTVYSAGPNDSHSGVMLLSNYHVDNKTSDQTATVNLFGVNLARQAGSNTVTHAGAVKVTGGCTLNVYAANITGGAVTGSGGAVFVEENGTVNAYSAVISGGSAGAGGGNIYMAPKSHGKFSSSRITGGNASGNGGNFLISENVYAEFSSTKITNGVAGNNGGNLWIGTADKDVYGNLVFAECTVSGGQATGANAGGGTGGNIVTARRTAINGGSVTDGKATNRAANIFVNNTELVIQLAAKITGGNSGSSNGGSVYVTGTDGLLTMHGTAQITGGTTTGKGDNLYVKNGTLKLTENAKITGGIVFENGLLTLAGTPVIAHADQKPASELLVFTGTAKVDAAAVNPEAQICISAGDYPDGKDVLTDLTTSQAETLKACLQVDTGALVCERQDDGKACLRIRTYTPQAQVVMAGEGGYDYATVEAAITAAAGSHTVKLLQDVQSIDAAGQTLYLDLNGHSVGTVKAAALYGADSATRLYGKGVDGNPDNTYGVIVSVASGTVVKPFYSYRDGTNLRKYLMISDGEGTSFHRYYTAIVRVAITPKTTAFSYEAAFLGDSAVKAAVDSGKVQYGMYFDAGNPQHIRATKKFIAGPYLDENLEHNYLRISVQNVLKDGADNDSRASLSLLAKAYMKSGSETEYSAQVVRSFNDVLKNANDVFDELKNQTLRDALVQMYRSYYTGMTTWTDANTGNIRGGAKYNCECGSISGDHLGECTGASLTWKPWDGKIKSGNYYLTEDRTAFVTLNDANVDMKLDLRGHKIQVTDARAVNLGAGKLTICDSEGGGFISGYGQGGDSLNAATITQWGGSRLTLYRVDVNVYNGGNGIQNGGAVFLQTDGTSFQMYDGDLTGCALPVGQEEGEYSGKGGTMFIGDGAAAVLDDVNVTGGMAWGGGNIYVNKGASLTLSGDTTVTGGYDYVQSSNIYSFGDLIIKDRVQIRDGIWNNGSGNLTNRNLRAQNSAATLTISDQVVIDGGVTVSNMKAVSLSGTPQIYQLDEDGAVNTFNAYTRHMRILGTTLVDATGLEPGAKIYAGTDASGHVFATVAADAGDWILDCFVSSEGVMNGPLVRTDSTHLAFYSDGYLYHCACACGTSDHMDGCDGTRLLWQELDEAAQEQLATENITGNYYLSADRTEPIILDHVDANFRLDLRGYDVKVTDGRAVNMGKGKLVICDSAGGGELIGYGQGSASPQGAVIRQWNGELSLYGVDVSVYGGGNKITSGGAAYIQGETDAFTFRMCGGTMTGCAATGNGGVLAVGGGKPRLRLQDVSITDGSCPGKGQSVYLGACQVWLDGKIRVDSVYMQNDTRLTIADTFRDDLSDIRINKDAAGTVTSVSRDHTAAIKSDLAGCKMVYEDGKLVLKAGTELIYHCLCGNVIYNADGTVRRQNRDSCHDGCNGASQTWTPWDGKVTSGYFYLLTPRTEAIALDSSGVDFKLDLRGIDIAATQSRAINLGAGKITVCDSVGGGSVMGYGHDANINSASINQWGGELTLYGVNVKALNGGNSIKNGGVVYVNNAAANFRMYGGSLEGTNVSERAGTMAVVLGANALLKDVTTKAGVSGQGYGNDIYLNDANLTVSGTPHIKDIYLGNADGTALKLDGGLNLTDSSIGVSLLDKEQPVAVNVKSDPTKIIRSTETALVDRYDASTGKLYLDGARLWVGYGRADITPDDDVPMGGYGNSENRWSNNVASGEVKYRLYTTCIAVTDEDGETVLLFTVDVVSPNTKWLSNVQNAVSEATGVPIDNIVLACTHQHCSPDPSLDSNEVIARWNANMPGWFVDAALQAMEDRSSATMSGTSTNTDRLNFVRHYVMSNGVYGGDNHNHMLDGVTAVEHASEADTELQMIKFERESGKDIWMVNWQTHPHRAGGGKKYELTSDIVGVFREEIEAAEDCHFAYFSGAGGNVNTTTRVAGASRTKDYIETGKELAKTALAAKDTFKPLDNGPVSVTKYNYVGKVNHTQDSMLEDAREIDAMWESECTAHNKKYCAECTVPAGMAKDPQIYSPFHASAIITKATLLGVTRPFDIWAMSIGDVGIAVVPYEMFDTNGKYVKDNSPFDMTFVMSQANYAHGYIPSAQAYEYGCYEADTGKYVSGTGEILADLYVDMLTKLRLGE